MTTKTKLVDLNQGHDSGSPILKLKSFLIKLIAGKDIVICNARIDIVDRPEGISGKFSGDNLIMSHVCVPDYGDKMLHVSQWRKGDA